MKQLLLLIFVILDIGNTSIYCMEQEENSVQSQQKRVVLSLQALALTELILDHAKKINTMQETVAQEMLIITASQLEHKIPEEFRLHYLPEVARTHYFLFNKYFDVGCDYGFSVGELITRNKIPKILGDLFAQACYIKNKFQIINNYRINSLNGLEMLPLRNYITHCTIYHNAIHTISSDLSCLSVLETIDLKFNKITVIEDNALQGLAKLTALNLSHNKIEKINKHSFTGCNQLQVLNLNDNKIDVIESDSLSHLGNLNILNLTGNKLSIVPHELSRLTHLQILMLGENSIPESKREDLERALENTSISWQKRSKACNSRTYIGTMHDDTT